MAASEVETMPRPRGRPRLPEVDEAVIEATLDLLAGVSYSDLSIEMISREAGVGKPTIYRRWSTKLDLVLDAYGRVSHVDPIEVPPGGDLRKAMREWVVTVFKKIADAGLGHVQSSLIGEMALHPELVETFVTKYALPRRQRFIAALRRAIDEGLLRKDADLELMHDLIIGQSLLRSIQGKMSGADALSEREVGKYFDKIWDLFKADDTPKTKRRVAKR